MVSRDFGLVGTGVEKGEHTPKVALHGGGLGVNLDRWVRAGDVFAVSRIRQEGPRRRATRLEWALLQVVDGPADGYCRCRYFHRFNDEALQEELGVVYRCLHLTTTTAPLRLRLLHTQTAAPFEGLQVNVSATGFGERVTELTSGADGAVVSPDAYKGLAFVEVKNSTETLAQIPVEIVDDRTVVCRVSVKEESEKARLQLRGEGWLRRLYEDLRLANSRVAELNGQLQGASEKALDQARAGLKGLTRELADLSAEHDALEAAGKQVPGALDLSEGEQRLRDLEGQRKQLVEFIASLEANLRENEQVRILKTMVQQGQGLENQAEFPKAIALYEQILQERPNETNVRRHLEDLKKRWELKGEDHKKAREFIYTVWPKKMDTATLKENLPKAWEVLRTCQKVGDQLSPVKMLPADLAHAGDLKGRVEQLNRSRDRQDTSEEKKTIKELNEDLRKLHIEAGNYVNQGKAPPKEAPAKTSALPRFPSPVLVEWFSREPRASALARGSRLNLGRPGQDTQVAGHQRRQWAGGGNSAQDDPQHPR
jgi:hypothetical protein